MWVARGAEELQYLSGAEREIWKEKWGMSSGMSKVSEQAGASLLHGGLLTERQCCITSIDDVWRHR